MEDEVSILEFGPRAVSFNSLLPPPRHQLDVPPFCALLRSLPLSSHFSASVSYALLRSLKANQILAPPSEVGHLEILRQLTSMTDSLLSLLMRPPAPSIWRIHIYFFLSSLLRTTCLLSHLRAVPINRVDSSLIQDSDIANFMFEPTTARRTPITPTYWLSFDLVFGHP